MNNTKLAFDRVGAEAIDYFNNQVFYRLFW